MDPPPWEPYPNMHLPQLSDPVSLPSPLQGPASPPAMGPLPCKRLWRDPRAPSMLLLMPKMIMPPRLGPVSAEMGEMVSRMGAPGSWGLQGSCQKH